MTRCVLVVLLLVIARAAYGDNPKLAAARRAIHDVRYDDARGLLVEALNTGGNSPDELLEIYQLSGATAVVLGQGELAEQYYRRVLALDPAAELAADASPRLRPTFVAAQAYMAAHGRLEARVTRRGHRIEVEVISDPLGMIAGVAAVVHGVTQPAIAISGHPVALEPSGAVERVALLDDHGNALRAIAVEPEPRPEPEPAAVAPPADAPPPSTPILRRWLTWAIPAVVLGGVGAGYLVRAQNAKSELDDILAHGADHFMTEAEPPRKRWKTDVRVADVLFAAAGAFTVTAIVMAVIRPSGSRTVVAPVASGRELGLMLDAKF